MKYPKKFRHYLLSSKLLKISSNFCGLLRIYEIYVSLDHTVHLLYCIFAFFIQSTFTDLLKDSNKKND
jgi:hypothetical protein